MLVRLTEGFLQRFDFEEQGITRERLYDWARTVRQPALTLNERDWSKLKNGEGVPRKLVEALSEYLSDHLKRGRYPVSEIAEDIGEERENPFKMGWHWFELLLGKIPPPKRAECLDESDLREVSRMVVMHVGRSTLKKPKASTGDLLTAGEQAMRRSEGEYRQWLTQFWSANPKTVMFAVARDRLSPGRSARIGATVILPIREASYRQLAGGEIDDVDLNQSSFQPKSCFLHFNAMASVETGGLLKKLTLIRAWLTTLAYQLAALSEEVSAGAKLSIIGFGGAEDIQAHAEDNGFSRLGKVTPKSGKPIMELAPPDRYPPGSPGRSLLNAKKHVLMQSLVQWVQFALAEEQQAV